MAAMKRVNVRFTSEAFAQLQQRAELNGDRSVANSIRELVDLGQQVEAAAAQSNGENKQQNDMDLIKDLLKENLIWCLETRFLARHMAAQTDSENTNSENILVKFKEKAKNYVLGKLGEADE